MDIQDRKKSLTAEELRRRYNLDDLSKDRKSIQLIKNTINKVEIEFQRFMNVVDESLNDYQSQVEITAWFFDGIPSSTQPEITTPADHAGDLYYDRENAKAYRYVLNGSTYEWQEITDGQEIETLAVESSKPDTFDNKRVIYTDTPTTPYSIGDIWMHEGTYYRCRAARESGTYSTTDWIIYTEYTDDMVLLDTRAELDRFETNVEQNYVTNTALETNTQGIYATVSSTYETITNVAAINSDLQDTKRDVVSIDTRLGVEEGKVSTLITEVGDRTQKQTSVTQDIDSIESQIQDIPTITTDSSGVGVRALLDLLYNRVIELRVHPTDTDILGQTVSQTLKANTGVKVLSRKIIFDGNTDYQYKIPCNLYCLNETYDEYIYDGYNQKIQVIHRIGFDEHDEKYVLQDPVTEEFEFYDMVIGAGDYEVFMMMYPTAYIYIKAMIENDYTTTFATSLEVDSKISQTANQIMLEVNEKVDENDIIAKLNVAVEDGQGIVELKGNSVTIDSDYFTLDAEGNIEANSGVLGDVLVDDGQMYIPIELDYNYDASDVQRVLDIFLEVIEPTEEDFLKYDFNRDGRITLSDAVETQRVVFFGIGKDTPGKILFKADGTRSKITIIGGNGVEYGKFGFDGISLSDYNGGSLSIGPSRISMINSTGESTVILPNSITLSDGTNEKVITATS